MVKDPICKMEVEPVKATVEAEYRGENYYFCLEACREKFEEKPEKFVQKIQTVG